MTCNREFLNFYHHFKCLYSKKSVRFNFMTCKKWDLSILVSMTSVRATRNVQVFRTNKRGNNGFLTWWWESPWCYKMICNRNHGKPYCILKKSWCSVPSGCVVWVLLFTNSRIGFSRCTSFSKTNTRNKAFGTGNNFAIWYYFVWNHRFFST